MSPIHVIRAAVLVLALSSLQGQSQAQQPRQPPTKPEVQSRPASRSDPVPENKSAAPGTLPQAGGKKRFLEDWLPSNPDEVRKSLLTALLTLATALIVFFSKQLGNGARRIGTVLWTRLRVQRASETHYRRSIAKELRSIQLFRMSEAKDLETFYVPLRLCKWIPSQFRREPSASSPDMIMLNDALDRFERIALLGDPGAGKTTTTSHCAAGISDKTWCICGEAYFPLFLPLRTLKPFLETEDSKTLRDLLAQTLETYDFASARKFVDRKLASGTCAIFLDGFDELIDKQGVLQLRLAQKVREFISSLHPKNRIVITSRTASYEAAWFPGFTVFELTDFTVTQMTAFVDGWFGATKREWAQSLTSLIAGSDRLQLLLKNPLMLAIVCFVYSCKHPSERFLPRRRVDIYDRCVHALISEWDHSRGVDRQPTFPPRDVERVLRHVAYDGLLHQRIDFTKAELLALIRTFLPDADRRQYEDEVFLEEVLEHTGLFKQKSQDTVGFLHRTFHEYFAAQVIQASTLAGIAEKDMRAKLRDVLQNLGDPAWAEPIALAAGMMRGRTELVTLLYKEYKKRPHSDLQLLLAACLRDAELENFDFDPSYLIIQDEILGSLVDLASSRRAMT